MKEIDLTDRDWFIANAVRASCELAKTAFPDEPVAAARITDSGWLCAEFQTEHHNILIPPWSDLDLRIREIIGEPRSLSRFVSLKTVQILGRDTAKILDVTDETDRELTACFQARISVHIDGHQHQIVGFERLYPRLSVFIANGANHAHR